MPTDADIARITARMAPFRPADDDELVVELYSRTDELGRSRFLLHWMGHRFALSGTGYEHGHCGQAFHANLAEHLERSAREGKRIRIIRVGEALGVDPYACLHGLPGHDPRPFPATCDTLGRLHMCACGRLWELREFVGFVVWAPADLANPPDEGLDRCAACGAHVFHYRGEYHVGGDMPCVDLDGHAPGVPRWNVTEATL